MATNFTGSEPELNPAAGEAPLFAATPVWERNRKKKGFGARRAPAAEAATVAVPEARVAPETRSFAQEEYAAPLADTSDRPMVERSMQPQMDRSLDRPMSSVDSIGSMERPIERPIERPTVAPSVMASPTPEAETATDAGMVAPISRTRTVKERRNGASPAVITGGLAALAAVGAIGWYASRPPAGVPELAPGAIDSQVAVAPLTPATPPAAQVAATTAAPPVTAPSRTAVARAAPARQDTSTARARPAAASADGGGVNASATTALPDGPQPYSTLNPGASPAAAAPPTIIVPPAATAAPAAIPQTPPTAPVETPAADSTPSAATPPT